MTMYALKIHWCGTELKLFWRACASSMKLLLWRKSSSHLNKILLLSSWTQLWDKGLGRKRSTREGGDDRKKCTIEEHERESNCGY